MSNDRASDPISTLQRVLVWVLMLLMPVALAFLAWMIAVFVKPDWRTIGLAGIEVPSETTFWIIVGVTFLVAAAVSVFVLYRLPSSLPTGQAFLFDDLVFCPECNLRTVPDSGECQFCDASLEGARKVTDPDPEAEAAAQARRDLEEDSDEDDGERPSMLDRLAFWRRSDDAEEEASDQHRSRLAGLAWRKQSDDDTSADDAEDDTAEDEDDDGEQPSRLSRLAFWRRPGDEAADPTEDERPSMLARLSWWDRSDEADDGESGDDTDEGDDGDSDHDDTDEGADDPEQDDGDESGTDPEPDDDPEPHPNSPEADADEDREPAGTQPPLFGAAAGDSSTTSGDAEAGDSPADPWTPVRADEDDGTETS